MSSIAIIFRRDKVNKKGLSPIHFRIIKDRRIQYISSGIMIADHQWDEKKTKIKKGVTNSARLNSFLNTKHAELQREMLKHETVSNNWTAKSLKQRILGPKPTDFFSFADSILESYKQSGQVGTYYKNQSIIRKFKQFANGKPLFFQDITQSFLLLYEKHSREVRFNHTNTIHKDMKFLRKLFNDALRQDLIEPNQNPFLKYRLKVEKTQRSYLTDDELSRIESFYTLPGTKLALHKDMFIFASYAGGLRISDLLQLRWQDFDRSHIHFSIKKTGQQLSIKLPNAALEIVSRYNTDSPDQIFIFPELSNRVDLNDPFKLDKALSYATSQVNKSLSKIANELGIQKKVTFHVSRHTWATRALRKGISIDKVSKIMGHAAIRETQIYAKIINEELDKAMDAFN